MNCVRHDSSLVFLSYMIRLIRRPMCVLWDGLAFFSQVVMNTSLRQVL